MEEASLKEQAEAIYARIQALRAESDGCSMSPDFNFTDCCIAHDLAYRKGIGSRKAADAELRCCIQGKGYVLLPGLYWLAVRVFGKKSWKNEDAKH